MRTSGPPPPPQSAPAALAFRYRVAGRPLSFETIDKSQRLFSMCVCLKICSYVGCVTSRPTGGGYGQHHSKRNLFSLSAVHNEPQSRADRINTTRQSKNINNNQVCSKSNSILCCYCCKSREFTSVPV